MDTIHILVGVIASVLLGVVGAVFGGIIGYSGFIGSLNLEPGGCAGMIVGSFCGVALGIASGFVGYHIVGNMFGVIVGPVVILVGIMAPSWLWLKLWRRNSSKVQQDQFSDRKR